MIPMTINLVYKFNYKIIPFTQLNNCHHFVAIRFVHLLELLIDQVHHQRDILPMTAVN